MENSFPCPLVHLPGWSIPGCRVVVVDTGIGFRGPDLRPSSRGGVSGGQMAEPTLTEPGHGSSAPAEGPFFLSSRVPWSGSYPANGLSTDRRLHLESIEKKLSGS